MIIYSESFHVEHSIEQDWVQEMKGIIIPEMLQTGKFSKAIFTKVTSHTDETGNTYSIQYYTKNQKELNDFYKNHSQKISHFICKKFGSKALSFKTELEILDVFEF